VVGEAEGASRDRDAVEGAEEEQAEQDGQGAEDLDEAALVDEQQVADVAEGGAVAGEQDGETEDEQRTSGRQQGEKKDRTPAARARGAASSRGPLVTSWDTSALTGVFRSGQVRSGQVTAWRGVGAWRAGRTARLLLTCLGIAGRVPSALSPPTTP
jgi:hypothetical protein